MDLNTVRSLRAAHERADLELAPGEAFLAGGSWLFSEPQEAVCGLVDLGALAWPAWTATPAGLSVAATCTIAHLRERAGRVGWSAAPLFAQCADALLMSFKIQNTATVGGNLCLGLPAGAMISLGAGLAGSVLLWSADGTERRLPVADFVTGDGHTTLAPGEVLRALEIPAASLRARTAFRKLALTPLGRSSAVVIGRLERDGRFALAITAATIRPVVLEFDGVPGEAELRAGVATVEDWHEDAHGPADWRAAISAELAVEIGAELSR